MKNQRTIKRPNYFCKLTSDDVRLIRQLHPDLSHRVLARKFDVSKRAIEAVVTRQTWRHVE
jgi:hypothetical protein